MGEDSPLLVNAFVPNRDPPAAGGTGKTAPFGVVRAVFHVKQDALLGHHRAGITYTQPIPI
ncbi:hypothetical protein B9Z33_03390 [Limnohabitans sp. T6-20]|nr:hypothetical protein B9Z33_03390 [Limnohabitans sp. T6-20]